MNTSVCRPWLKGITAALSVFAAIAIVGNSAHAAGSCRTVVGHFDIQHVPPAESPSVVGLCGNGNFNGTLRGEYFSPFLSIVPTAETPTTGVVLFTAEATLHARLGNKTGDILFKEAGSYHTVGEGEFAELFSIVGGTGDFTGASGTLYATGTSTAEGGEAVYFGQVCTP